MDSKTFLKSKTALVYDYGSHIEIASRLGRDFGKVYYYVHVQDSVPRAENVISGAGFPGITVIEDFFDYVDKADCIIFPDNLCSDISEFLKSKGYPVIGGGKAEFMENDRQTMRKLQGKLGLRVQKTLYVHGFSNLIKEIKDLENKYIKVNKFRGDMTTFFYKNYEQSLYHLNKLEGDLGGTKEMIDFIVEDKLGGGDTVEVGVDGFMNGGDLVSPTLYGYISDDWCCIEKACDYDSLPKQLIEVQEKLKPVFKKFDTRSFWGDEIRVLGKDEFYLTDPCVRTGDPSACAINTEMILNYSEFMYGLAHGIKVKPIMRAKYAFSVTIESEHTKKRWFTVRIPENKKQFVKVYRGMKEGENYQIPIESSFVLTVIGFGDTPEAALEDCKKNSEGIEGMDVKVSFEGFDDLKKKMEAGKKLGVNF